MERVEPAPEKAEEVGAGKEGREPACPWCGSPEAEKVSDYGPHLMVCQYICRGCNSPFEVIKR